MQHQPKAFTNGRGRAPQTPNPLNPQNPSQLMSIRTATSRAKAHYFPTRYLPANQNPHADVCKCFTQELANGATSQEEEDSLKKGKKQIGTTVSLTVRLTVPKLF
jgi:hypothetical protein